MPATGTRDPEFVEGPVDGGEAHAEFTGELRR